MSSKRMVKCGLRGSSLMHFSRNWQWAVYRQLGNELSNIVGHIDIFGKSTDRPVRL